MQNRTISIDPALFTYGVNLEANFAIRFVIQDIASVEHESGLLHLRVDSVNVNRLELVPFREYRQRMRMMRRFIGSLAN